MSISVIDAALMQKAFLAGAKALEAKKEWINELNVFPVPDGDTGTNMTMTIMAAAREVAAIENPTFESLAKAISSGSLRGARGNSGVILSQLLRGFTKEMKSVDEVTVTILANAMVRGAETAYKAVMKPKEGTILTVAKGMADKGVELVSQTEDIESFAKQIVAHGDYVLSQTPELLPVLKQAGVVDSGGQGLMEVIRGAVDAILGKEVDFSLAASVPTVFEGGAGNSSTLEHIDTADIKFGYCTEFIINLDKPYNQETEQQWKSYLESIGDSIVVVSDDDIVKVHVHTNDPGLAIQRALTYGTLSRMKIDNMREEHEERLLQEIKKQSLAESKDGDNAIEDSGERKPYGFIAVSVGEGLGEIFKGIGADYLIEGGQTMNPSTEDMVNAIDRIHADTIYILPNNKNIILAAEQAKYLVSDKTIIVIPSKTVPQGITALINFTPDLSPEKNLQTMVQEMNRVKTGQITYAVRNTTIDDIEIHEGDIMGIGDSGMLCVGNAIHKTTIDTLGKMIEGDTELITIYYGNEVEESDAETILEEAQGLYPQCEIELHRGGQPIYYYIISVE